MFDEFGQSVLTDFGIAKAASGQKLTGTGMSIGTPHYMSPEQARAQAIDGRSDIYSLGVVAYQCLTGTVPYDGEDSFSIGYKHITEPIPTPSLVTADERRIFEVIKRMLMKDPNDRFQSCEELVASFRGQPIAAPGAVRVSAATFVGTGAAAVAGSAASVGGAGLPPIVSQPTTPLESPLVNRRMTPLERRDVPRRVADRSMAMRPAHLHGHGSGCCWRCWGGPGAHSTTTRREGLRRAISLPSRHSIPCRRGIRRVLTPSRFRHRPAPVAADPTTAGARLVSCALTPAPAEVAGSPEVTGPVDSGGIRLVGLPRGSTVLIDEKPISEGIDPPGARASCTRHLRSAVQLLSPTRW